MAAIEKDKFILVDEKYNSGMAVDEYNGKNVLTSFVIRSMGKVQ